MICDLVSYMGREKGTACFSLTSVLVHCVTITSCSCGIVSGRCQNTYATENDHYLCIVEIPGLERGNCSHFSGYLISLSN